MTEQTELLREMRDLLRVIAEPALAKRDEKLRESLSRIVGRNDAKAKAVLLMDGTRTQATIIRESGIEQSALSKCVKALKQASLIAADDQHPKLMISIPPNFFERRMEA